MPSLSSHLGGSGAPAPARAGSGRPAHTNDNDDDDTRAPHADAADPTSTPASDAAALSSLHDAKHRVAFARSVSRDASALSSRPTRVDPDTLPRRKYSGERERPPMPQQTHMMTTTYHDDDDDGPSSGDRPARPEGAAFDEPPVDWRKKKVEVIKILHADGTVTYPRDVEVEFGGKMVKPDMKKYEHLAPGDPLPPGLRVPGWTHMPEDVLAPPPLPTADDLKFGNPKFKPPEANDPEFIKRAREAIERDKIKNVPPRPDHPFADPARRLYRQPDGTLGPKRPPRKPYTVAARREFADLCYYARTNGGCVKCTEGVCHRHGTGVLWAHHRAYLAQMGLEPEWDHDGEFYGWDPEKTQPLADPEHVFCRMMGNDWMDYHKHQRHLKHYKGIEYDKESGEFFDFDSVTKEELDAIIKAGEAEVEFDENGKPITDWYKTKEGKKHVPYNPHTDGPRNMFAAKEGEPQEGCLVTEGEGRKWGKFAEGGEDFETALGNLDVIDDDSCDEVDTGERSEKTSEKKKGKEKKKKPWTFFKG